MSNSTGHLVLSRKPGEFIRVVVQPSTQPKTLWINVAAVNLSRARIGLLAETDIEILRAELTSEGAPSLADAVI